MNSFPPGLAIVICREKSAKTRSLHRAAVPLERRHAGKTEYDAKSTPELQIGGDF
jgi:hypothetical protein